jgi:hypothetical protein
MGKLWTINNKPRKNIGKPHGQNMRKTGKKWGTYRKPWKNIGNTWKTIGNWGKAWKPH